MKKIYMLVLTMAIMLYGCTKNFDSMNINPAQPTPESVEPSNQLTYLEKWGSFGNADLHERIHNLYVDMFAQYYMDTWFTSCNYVMNDGWQQDYWPQFWSWINNANLIISVNKDKADKVNIVQIARIWKVFMFHRATDLFGDLPYTKAADGSGITPPYDSQEVIYKDMLNELKDAVSKLDPTKESTVLATNDIIYAGSTTMWKKFGNSLRLRLAMRLTEVDAALAKTNAEEAVTGGVLEQGDAYPGVPSSTTEWGQEYPIPMYVSWGDLCLTESMYNILAGLGGITNTAYFTTGKGDPRGSFYFTLYNDSLKPMKAGLSAASRATEAANMSKFSKPNTNTYTKARALCLYPVSEAYFLRAEGAARGWTMGGTAQEMYEKGITVSMTDLGISGATIASYIASADLNANSVSVVWNDGATLDQKLDKIITQKYIAGFPDNSWEAWADQRRLLKPALVPIEDPMGSGVTKYESGAIGHQYFIEKILLPSTEAIDDPVEYAKVQANDKITVPVWWTGRAK